MYYCNSTAGNRRLYQTYMTMTDASLHQQSFNFPPIDALDAESGFVFDPSHPDVVSHLQLVTKCLISVAIEYTDMAKFCEVENIDPDKMQAMIDYYTPYLHTTDEFQHLLYLVELTIDIEAIVRKRLYKAFRRFSPATSWSRETILKYTGMTILHLLAYLESTFTGIMDWKQVIAGRYFCIVFHFIWSIFVLTISFLYR